MNTYIETKTLNKIVLRMDKSYSSFLYFTLESNENISFYSTLAFEKGQKFRDIVIYTTPELYPHLQHVLEYSMKRAEIEVIESCQIIDS